jgi:putative membrane protein
VSTEQKLTYDKLSAFSSAEFDKEFMSHNVSDHEGDLKDFKEQADRGTDADVKAFAAKTLQMLQTHLELSKQVAAKVKS